MIAAHVVYGLVLGALVRVPKPWERTTA
jgi:hypothetical protein